MVDWPEEALKQAYPEPGEVLMLRAAAQLPWMCPWWLHLLNKNSHCQPLSKRIFEALMTAFALTGRGLGFRGARALLKNRTVVCV